MGLNPSFRKKGKWPGVEGSLADDLVVHPADFFAWAGVAGGRSDRHDLAVRVEQAAKEKHHFFSLARDIVDRLRVQPQSWHHFDIFAVREPSSLKLFDVCMRDGKLSDFGEALWNLFVEALEGCRPKMVIFFSAEASRIYKARREPREDVNRGCHVDDFGSGPVPVLFAGFPTYMDLFSRARLMWHADKLWNGNWPVSTP